MPDTTDPRLLTILSEVCREARAIGDTVFRIKALRARMAAVGEEAVGTAGYPLPGDLSHITSPRMLVASLTALDMIDRALSAPLDGDKEGTPVLLALLALVR